MRHILKELGLSSARIKQTSSDCVMPSRSSIVSKLVLSSQAHLMASEMSAGVKREKVMERLLGMSSE
jgi:hypothetical protein